jgi:transcription initiation factor IIE alpha subunit
MTSYAVGIVCCHCDILFNTSDLSDEDCEHLVNKEPFKCPACGRILKEIDVDYFWLCEEA